MSFQLQPLSWEPQMHTQHKGLKKKKKKEKKQNVIISRLVCLCKMTMLAHTRQQACCIASQREEGEKKL